METASLMHSISPHSCPVDMISYGRSQALTFSSSKICRNYIFSYMASCSCRRSSFDLTMRRRTSQVISSVNFEAYRILFVCMLAVSCWSKGLVSSGGMSAPSSSSSDRSSYRDALLMLRSFKQDPFLESTNGSWFNIFKPRSHSGGFGAWAIKISVSLTSKLKGGVIEALDASSSSFWYCSEVIDSVLKTSVGIFFIFF